MNASVLIVGSQGFSAALLSQLRDFTALSIAVATTMEQAKLQIRSQMPDLLLLQLSQTGSHQFCQDLKRKPRLAQIYCIGLDDLSSEAPNRARSQVADASQMAQILEMGADAYMPCPQWDELNSALGASPKRQEQNEKHHPADLGRLLKAQLGAGLRRVEQQRSLVHRNQLLSTIAFSDPLTHLHNRRALEWELPRQVQAAHNHNASLSLMVLDIDYFKKVNDQHGHLVGDRVLQCLTKRLQAHLRLCDLPFRYGGEEFVVLLKGTALQEALPIAQRLRHAIQAHPFQIRSTLSLNLTISIGVSALLPQDDASGTSLFDRADQNLLQAKANGRNRVLASQTAPRHDVRSSLSLRSPTSSPGPCSTSYQSRDWTTITA